MLAYAAYEINVDDGSPILINAFSGNEWSEVAKLNICPRQRLHKTRNTNRFIIELPDMGSGYDLYDIRDGKAHCVGREITGRTEWLYETTSGFHQMRDGSRNQIMTKSIHESGWKYMLAPEGTYWAVNSYDDDNIYIIVRNTSYVPVDLDPSIRIMGYTPSSNIHIAANIVRDGIMHVHDAHSGSIIRYDPRLSMTGTTIYSEAARGEHMQSIFLNDHVFVKIWKDRTIDMVDLRNLATYALPSLAPHKYSFGMIGIYG
jgi:hypothetical protein